MWKLAEHLLLLNLIQYQIPGAKRRGSISPYPYIWKHKWFWNVKNDFNMHWNQCKNHIQAPWEIFWSAWIWMLDKEVNLRNVCLMWYMLYKISVRIPFEMSVAIFSRIALWLWFLSRTAHFLSFCVTDTLAQFLSSLSGQKTQKFPSKYQEWFFGN